MSQETNFLKPKSIRIPAWTTINLMLEVSIKKTIHEKYKKLLRQDLSVA